MAVPTTTGGSGINSQPRRGSSSRALRTDRIFRSGTLIAAGTAPVLIVAIGIALIVAAKRSIILNGLGFFLGEKWKPNPPTAMMHVGNIFGVLPFVYGTLLTSLIALALAVPIGVGGAIFLAEIAPRKLSTPLSFFVEMLAAVPSIVYGYWGLSYLCPILVGIEHWLTTNFGHIPFFATTIGTGTGQDFFAAGLVLTLMILPFITAVSRDVLQTVPVSQREAALGLGATRWEAIRTVVLRYASSGIIGAVMLGLGRALGETMAVTMVIGGSVTIGHLKNLASFSIFRSGYTMTSLLMDQYPSPNSSLHAAALTQVALTLFLITVVVNAIARGLVWLTAMKAGGGSDNSVRLKVLVSSSLKNGFLACIVVVFLFQAASDIKHLGAAGVFGGAEVVFMLAIVLWAISRILTNSRWQPQWRRFASAMGIAACAFCTLIAVGALIGLLTYVVQHGLPALNAGFFHKPDPDNPDSGGMLHAVVGTAELVFMAALIGIPTGILGGIYLSEFGNDRVGFVIRFFADLLNGVPSIVLGIFAYAIIVVTTTAYQGVAGGVALAIMMIPTVMRTTEELMRLVPDSLREGSLGLGATNARTVWKVVLPSARGGILTGALLAIARVSGETAPLIMVGCSSNLFHLDPRHALASLPVTIYVLRNAPSNLAIQQSWSAALVLVALVLIASLLARLISSRGIAATRTG